MCASPVARASPTRRSSDRRESPPVGRALSGQASLKPPSSRASAAPATTGAWRIQEEKGCGGRRWRPRRASVCDRRCLLRSMGSFRRRRLPTSPRTCSAASRVAGSPASRPSSPIPSGSAVRVARRAENDHYIDRRAVMKQVLAVICIALVSVGAAVASTGKAGKKVVWTESKAERSVLDGATVRLATEDRVALEAELRPAIALYKALALESTLTGHIQDADAYYEEAYRYSRALARCAAWPADRQRGLHGIGRRGRLDSASAPSGATSRPGRSRFRRSGTRMMVSRPTTSSRGRSARSRPNWT